ncbi:hypothetical protein N7455_001882 [Penicillium solitum]|uniref:uncharacterized protein n=1 Tax=Penicillium solitum TaxID=60172 RepID=UPI0032C496AF|nr:hypothetical protein N7536_005627 [Penicillium majusculum]KAJ5878417.1 hypothetical protein N7455_001882 [Penicillium solitum]
MAYDFAENNVSDSSNTSNDLKRSDSQSSVHMENIGTLERTATLEMIQTVSTGGHFPKDRVWNNESLYNPSNWPHWKKNAQILMVAFHSMVGTFMAAGIVPAYDTLAEMYGVEVQDVSYLTSVQILLLGLSPLVWNPITAIYGRYPVALLSVFGSMVCNIGGARCTSYGAQMATRAITAILISPTIGNGSGVITELAEPEHRGKKLGWWTLMTTLGVPAGPFFMGFVVKRIGVQWIFWIYTIINFCQLLMYLAIGDETIYNPHHERKIAGFWGKVVPRKISSHSLKIQDIFLPFTLAQYPRVVVAAFAHAICFCYANVALSVEMPAVFGSKFGFDSQQIGLQFIPVIIGCVLGEQLSGPMCDWFLGRVRKAKGDACPADRLWLSYIAFGTVFAGVLTWGFQLENAIAWNVTPSVGIAIASFGNQMQTTILTTFAVESKRDRASQVGVFVNFCRQLWGFIGPFYFTPMFDTLGLGVSSGIFVAIIAGCSLLPIIAIQFTATRADRR